MQERDSVTHNATMTSAPIAPPTVASPTTALTARRRGGAYCNHTAECFFGARNGTYLEPEEGVNYTQETLRYMTPRVRADEITALILDIVQFRDLVIYESCAGIGGNTLSFLDRPEFRLVVSYEIQADRFAMLETNVRAYGFAAPPPVSSPALEAGSASRWDGRLRGFEPPPLHEIGSIVYMDPPWLDGRADPLQAGTESYLSRGIRFGGRTIEQWLGLLLHCPLVVMRVPPGYQLGPVQGWRYERMDIKKSTLYVCRSVSGFIRLHEAILAANEPPRVTDLSSGALPYNDDRYLQWARGLQRFVYDRLLRGAVPDDGARLAYVTSSAMAWWIRALTHETFDRDNNYERLELEGDSILDAVISEYLFETFPDYDEGELTNARSSIGDKTRLSAFSNQLGLTHYLLLPMPDLHSRDVHEDVFESTVGALYNVAKGIVANARVEPIVATTAARGAREVPAVAKEICDAAFAVVRAYIRSIPGYLASATPRENSITVFKNYLNAFGWGTYAGGRVRGPEREEGGFEKQSRYIRDKVTQSDRNRKWTVAITLTPEGAQFFHSGTFQSRRLQRQIQAGEIGTATANTQKDAYMQAAAQAVQRFRDAGIGDDFLEEQRRIRDNRKLNARGEQLIKPLLITIKSVYGDRANFEFFSSSKFSEEYKLVQLYATVPPLAPQVVGGPPSTQTGGGPPPAGQTTERSRYVLLLTRNLRREGRGFDVRAEQMVIRDYLQLMGTERLTELVERMRGRYISFQMSEEPPNMVIRGIVSTGGRARLDPTVLASTPLTADRAADRRRLVATLL